MANFPPLKNYMFYCLDRLLSQYDISPPFLDVGCGVGEISRYVAAKGWHGKAIDFSNIAIEKARDHFQGNLSRVAQELEISRSALYRKMKKYELTD